MKQVTITISGEINTGKSFLKQEIVSHLMELGLLNVYCDMSDVDKNLTTIKEHQIVRSLNESNVKIMVNTKQLARSINE